MTASAVPLVASVVQIYATDAVVHRRMCWATLAATNHLLAAKIVSISEISISATATPTPTATATATDL